MLRSIDDLRTAIFSCQPEHFVSHYIFEPVPHIFDNNLDSWISWKSTLASAIDVDPYDIVLTGSAALGYSLNPNKRFKKFDNESDIDCGIISEYYFNIAWRYLRNLQTSWAALPSPTRNAIKEHRKHFVFLGTIATDRIVGLLPFGKEWSDALNTMSTIDPTEGRSVKFRIYKDYGALRSYQASNLRRLREETVHPEPDEDAIIPVEQ